MGYRASLYLIDNKSLKELKVLTRKKILNIFKEELNEIYRIDLIEKFNAKELYSLGEPNWSNEFEQFLKPLLKNKIVHERYNEDQELRIMTKEGLNFLIEFYHGRIFDFYKNQSKLTETILNIIDEIDKTNTKSIKKEKLEQVIKNNYSNKFEFNRKIRNLNMNTKGMEYEWEKDHNPYNLEGERLTDSWKYEYAIFELVRMYKEIDFKNNTIIFTAG